MQVGSLSHQPGVRQSRAGSVEKEGGRARANERARLATYLGTTDRDAHGAMLT
jgi:hypothetical protein